MTEEESPSDSSPKGLESSTLGEREEGLWKLEELSYLMWKSILENSMENLGIVDIKYKENKAN